MSDENETVPPAPVGQVERHVRPGGMRSLLAELSDEQLLGLQRGLAVLQWEEEKQQQAERMQRRAARYEAERLEEKRKKEARKKMLDAVGGGLDDHIELLPVIEHWQMEWPCLEEA